MPISRSAAARVQRFSQTPITVAVPSAPVDRTPAEVLAQRLCIELQALTGNAHSSVLLDILLKRLRVGLRELESALAFAAECGWIERRADSAALQDKGREATLVSWPPREPTLPSQARLR